MTDPTWPDLIGLMATGESGEAPFSGILEVDGWYSGVHRTETLPDTVRVLKTGRRYRVETLAGKPLFIRGTDCAWRFPRASTVPILVRDVDGAADQCFGSYSAAIDRPDANSWSDRGVDGLVGPVVATEYLGRAAWNVEVRASTTSPATAHLTIDSSTGLVLRWGDGLFGDDFRWTRINDLPEVADDLVTWTGETLEPVATVPEVAAPRYPSAPVVEAPRSDVAEPHDIAPLAITVTGEPEIFEMTQDGSFHLGYDLGGFVTVMRRPHHDTPRRVEEREGWTTWTEDGWDWSLKVPAGMQADQIAVIRHQLRTRHRDVG